MDFSFLFITWDFASLIKTKLVWLFMSEESIVVIQNKSVHLFITFLKIGSTAFGGFMALISVVQNYVVDRNKLISHSVMVDGVSLAIIFNIFSRNWH